MTYLFVGGPEDGMRHYLPDEPTVYRFAAVHRNPLARPGGAWEPPAVTTYRRLTLIPSVVVYAFSELTGADIVERLVEHYSPPLPPPAA